MVPVEVSLSGDTLTARGHFVLRQTDYGMAPASVAGVVKVKDEVAVDLQIVAARTPPKKAVDGEPAAKQPSDPDLRTGLGS